MRCTSSIAARAARPAAAASSAWTCNSFSAAIARNVKRCSAMVFNCRLVPRPRGLESAAHAENSIVRAQGLEELAATAAGVELARILDVADRPLEAPAAGEQVLRAERGREPAEGREPLVAREDPGLRAGNERRIEVGLRLRVVAKRRPQRPPLAHRLAPGNLERVRPDPP